MENNTELSGLLETAKEHLSFYPAQFIYTALPYTEPDSNYWVRENGTHRLTISAGTIQVPHGGVESFVPSGKLARASLLYLTTEAKKTGSPRIEMATSYRGFLEDLGITWNSQTAREAVRQLRAVLSMHVQVILNEPGENGDVKVTEYDFKIGRGREITFDKNSNIKERESVLLLADDFFSAVIDGHAVPIVTGAWRELLNSTKSPMALDIYLWLSSRLPVVQGEVRVGWEQLQAQFGSQANDIRGFKRHFRPALQQALTMYPGANVREIGANTRGTAKGFKGLLLRRSVAPQEPPALTASTRKKPPRPPLITPEAGALSGEGEGIA